MNATAFWHDVAECRRLLRQYRHVQDEVKKLTPARRIVRRLLPWAVVPLLALPWWHLLGISLWFGYGPLILVLLGSLPANPPWKLTTFEALHMPSRRSLYIARLEPWLLWWLWGGVWGTAGLLIANWRAVRNVEQAVLYLYIGAQVPWLALSLLGANTLLSRIWGKVWTWVLITCFMFIPFMLGILIPLLQIRMAFNVAQAFSAHLALFGPLMLLLEVGLLALQVWALDHLEPMRQINPLMGTQLDPQLAHQKAPMAGAVRSRGVRGKLGPAPFLAGRHGLGWAAAYYACFKLWDGGLRGFLSRALQSWVFLWPLVIPTGLNGNLVWIAMFPGIFFSALTGSIVQGSNLQRLYLFGVDYRSQLAHRLKTFWLTPAVLLVAIGAILASALWGKHDIALALLAVWAGLALLSEGWFGWPALPMVLGTRIGCLSQLLVFLVLALWAGLLAGVDLGLGSRATRVELFAAACGAFGLAGILYKWWRLDEDRLAEAAASAQASAAQLAKWQRSRTGAREA
jgi:hypothetical protein